MRAPQHFESPDISFPDPVPTSLLTPFTETGRNMNACVSGNIRPSKVAVLSDIVAIAVVPRQTGLWVRQISTSGYPLVTEDR